MWLDLGEVMQSILRSKKAVIGMDFNGHVGEGNTAQVVSTLDIQERNAEGQVVVCKKEGNNLSDYFFYRRGKKIE